jgi:hypothetical protein
MLTDVEHIDHQNAIAEAFDYMRTDGHTKVVECFEWHEWTVDIDWNKLYIKATKSLPYQLSKSGPTTFNPVIFTIERNFATIRFHDRGSGVDEIILWWVPNEACFRTFTFRKVTAKEIPGYIDLLLRNEARPLTKRLIEYKETF